MTTETSHLHPAPWAVSAWAHLSDFVRTVAQRRRDKLAKAAIKRLSNTSFRMFDHDFNERTRLAIHHLPF